MRGLVLAVCMLAAVPAFAGSEDVATPTPTPFPTPPPGPGGEMASPTPTPAPGAKKKEGTRLFPGLGDKFPYLRVAGGFAAGGVRRSSTVEIDGDESDPADSRVGGGGAAIEATLGALVRPHLLASGTLYYSGYYAKIDREDGPSVPLVGDLANVNFVGFSLDWLEKPRGGGLWAGGTLGVALFAATIDKDKDDPGPDRIGSAGPAISVAAGWFDGSERSHVQNFRPGIQVRLFAAPFLRGEEADKANDSIVYREESAAFGGSVMLTIRYF